MAEQPPASGSTPDRDILRQKIQFVRDALRRLRQIRDEGKRAYLDDWKSQDATVRILQVGVEAILDAANHIIAREGLGIPKTYAEAITILTREGILPPAKREDLVRMVQFRNRAVHLYDEVDQEEIWNILEHHLADFEAVIEAFVDRYF